ncbi:MAG: DUF5715 family protein [Acidobacteriota bacterium]
MTKPARQLFLLVIASAALGLGLWALLRFPSFKRRGPDQPIPANATADPDRWARAVERVKEPRAETENVGIEIPPQLRHYPDRHWFLATQVAEVRKSNVQSVQDFVDLAAMIERGEIVSVPAVTDDYVLFGVGAKADDGVFARYVDDHNIELYNDAELRDAYARLESARSKLEAETSNLKKQLAGLKKGTRARQRELQKEIDARGQELSSNAEDKQLLDGAYGQPENRQKLLRDYESLQRLAQNFGGRSYNLADPSDREAMKVHMLGSLRPQALKILEELAKTYHDKFDRPLPISSLVRPEQYQRELRKVNRNATLIDTPPHSTGLAFDIDYRYMSGAEQTFVMAELARLKDEGRIEVLRERNANYHVFAFIDGKRPGDDLITASLQDAGAPLEEANHATKPPAKAERKSRTSKRTQSKSKARKPAAKSRAKKRR